ncbi:hypothetical protein NDU88_006791 [Pleurodeles waltl]|uniref:Uncharacterized protein n=1 Tax=Pleurodeles waltl TaxID=8319 RepID=A0AAV7UR22_PLEWA|nr:hypothetical protein NDU88_006791 [Pleurodeles waltl]
MMSVMDPHLVCLWCLEGDHNPKSCSECRAMNPKALRERSLKLMAARHSISHCLPVALERKVRRPVSESPQFFFAQAIWTFG